MSQKRPPARANDLQLEEDLNFQQRQWVFQRVVWMVMLGVVVLGLLGLFGSGPLSTVTIDSDNQQFEYERFTRANDPTELQFQLKKVAPGKLLIRLDRRLLETVNFDTVQPEPSSIKLEGQWVAYAFEIAEQNSSTIRFVITRDQAGILNTRVKVGDDEVLEFWQFAFP